MVEGEGVPARPGRPKIIHDQLPLGQEGDRQLEWQPGPRRSRRQLDEALGALKGQWLSAIARATERWTEGFDREPLADRLVGVVHKLQVARHELGKNPNLLVGLTMAAGRKSLTKRDWPFGARSRRELLKVVLAEDAPAEGWTAAELARAVRVSENGSLDPHLAGLCQWKVLKRGKGGRFLQAEPMVELGLQLRELLEVVEAEPDAKLQDLRRRSYRRS